MLAWESGTKVNFFSTICGLRYLRFKNLLYCRKAKGYSRKAKGYCRKANGYSEGFLNLVAPGRGLAANSGKKIHFCPDSLGQPFRIFLMPARFSKRDFWNLGEIWDRNMWTKIFLSTKFSSKKSEHFLTKNFRFLIDIFSLKKSMKIQNFENFENFSTFQNFEFSLTFSTNNFSIKNRKFLVPKNFDQKVFGFFWRKFCRQKYFCSYIPIPNFPQIPKITLRKACGH